MIQLHGASLRNLEIGIMFSNKGIGGGGFLQFMGVANSSRNHRIRVHRAPSESGGKI